LVLFLQADEILKNTAGEIGPAGSFLNEAVRNILVTIVWVKKIKRNKELKLRCKSQINPDRK
jgi:hypothetical protein